MNFTEQQGAQWSHHAYSWHQVRRRSYVIRGQCLTVSTVARPGMATSGIGRHEIEPAVVYRQPFS
jgi:hypothetical protein